MKFKQWLNEVRVYHSTQKENIPGILKHGIKTGTGYAASGPVVFGFTEPNRAYGNTIVAFDIPDEDADIDVDTVRVYRSIKPHEIVAIIEELKPGDKVQGFNPSTKKPFTTTLKDKTDQHGDFWTTTDNKFASEKIHKLRKI